MSDSRTLNISLTGYKSHQVKIPKGQGSFSIGTKGVSEGKYDVWVDQDSPINWDAFNEFFTSYGEQHAESYPYGDWPRFFYYSGNDQGFIDWSAKRKIEELRWTPHSDAVVDLTKADITRMFISTEVHNIRLFVGDKIRDLFLLGSLDWIDIEESSCTPPYLYFSPLCPKKETTPYQLPIFRAFEQASSVGVSNSPADGAFDCRSLLQFRNLRSLNLTGNMTNLDALSDLKQLQHIGLRYVPDLSRMPKLTVWPDLKSFIGYNIEETDGKLLRAELRKLMKEKEMEYSSVTNLRKAIWFATEYGIPFSDWDSKNSKIATKAFKACMKEIKKTNTEDQVCDAITCFIAVINQLDNIETGEREDVWVAVTQLIESSALEISEETGRKWFDEIRDF